MHVWTVANQKGGVGKTTTVVSLGGLCAQRGLRTLVVDLDPHGSLSSYFRLDPESVNPGLYELFRNDGQLEPAMLRPTGVEGLSLLPASTALATLDRQLGTRKGMGLILRRALQRLDGEFERVLLDCPPMLGVLMVNALAASQRVIIPVQTEFLAVKGLERMMRTLAMIQRSRNEAQPQTIVPTLYDQRTRASVETLALLRHEYSEILWDDVIPEDTLFREASKQAMPLTVLRPWARGSQAYRRLLATVEATAEDDHMAKVLGDDAAI
ncbi:Sporulation initiation inhibitor protein Soj [wastewater metagenome]|uniref:Sporulation initiation inhibitor protein Soj n=3 Tax=root TaxID=1 RepID=A0A5B8R8Y8_9ZZZZ|nr:ParA family protein [Arhodomonas aquaeolei]MCS4502775.1 ParA family protein [Arhodomonas aquaeolei]QEA03742.1 sporulation initiation inhibitor protein Soj [uncultured organism]